MPYPCAQTYRGCSKCWNIDIIYLLKSSLGTNNQRYLKTDKGEHKNRNMKLGPFGGSFTLDFYELKK